MQSKSLKCLRSLSCISVLKNTNKTIMTEKNKLPLTLLVPRAQNCEQTCFFFLNCAVVLFLVLTWEEKRSCKSQTNDSPLSERFSKRLFGVWELVPQQQEVCFCQTVKQHPSHCSLGNTEGSNSDQDFGMLRRRKNTMMLVTERQQASFQLLCQTSLTDQNPLSDARILFLLAKTLKTS